MNHPLSHILDRSHCLTKRQLTGYVRRTASEEEIYAIETHLNSCTLCSSAVDGMLLHGDEAMEALGELSPAFIKAHFDQIRPQIHLNSVAAVASAPASSTASTRRVKVINWDRVKQMVPLAAVLLVGVGLFWHWQNIQSADRPAGAIATNLDQPSAARAPADESVAKTRSGVVSEPPEKAAQDRQKSAPGPAGSDDAVAYKADAARPAPTVAPAAKPAATPVLAEAKNKVAVADESLPQAQRSAAREQGQPGAADRNATLANASVSAAPPSGNAAQKKDAAKARADQSDVAAGNASMAVDHLSEGDAQFADDNYTAAIRHYKQESGSTDKARSQRARLMTARSYIRMGQYEKARPILESIVREGGPEKKAAKRLLKDTE